MVGRWNFILKRSLFRGRSFIFGGVNKKNLTWVLCWNFSEQIQWILLYTKLEIPLSPKGGFRPERKYNYSNRFSIIFRSNFGYPGPSKIGLPSLVLPQKHVGLGGSIILGLEVRLLFALPNPACGWYCEVFHFRCWHLLLRSCWEGLVIFLENHGLPVQSLQIGLWQLWEIPATPNLWLAVSLVRNPFTSYTKNLPFTFRIHGTGILTYHFPINLCHSWIGKYTSHSHRNPGWMGFFVVSPPRGWPWGSFKPFFFTSPSLPVGQLENFHPTYRTWKSLVTNVTCCKKGLVFLRSVFSKKPKQAQLFKEYVLCTHSDPNMSSNAENSISMPFWPWEGVPLKYWLFHMRQGEKIHNF